MKQCPPYWWIQSDSAVFKAMMSGVLPIAASDLETPLDLWSVIELCWQADPEKRATGTIARTALTNLVR